MTFGRRRRAVRSVAQRRPRLHRLPLSPAAMGGWMVTQAQLKNVMKQQLQRFNDDGVTRTLSSARLYKGVIRFVLKRNNNVDPRWPNDWLAMSVKDLASALLP